MISKGEVDLSFQAQAGSITSGLTQCEGILHGDFAASYGEG
jgi:hypothetical protein